MIWLNDLKVSHKLALAFGTCLVMAVIAGGIAIIKMADMNQKADKIANSALAGSAALNHLGADIRMYRLWQLRIATAATPKAVDAVNLSLAKYHDSVTASTASYFKAAADPQDIRNAKSLVAAFDSLVSYSPQMLLARSKNDLAKVDSLVTVDSFAYSKACYDLLDTMSDWNVAHGKALSDSAKAAYVSGRSLVVIFLAVALLLGVTSATLVTREILASLVSVAGKMESFHHGLATLADNNEALGENDLIPRAIHVTELMSWTRKDEFGDLARTFDAMLSEGKRAVSGLTHAQGSLSKLICQTRDSTEMIASTSLQIASGNEDLSHRTSEQASSLEETAASMEEMTSVIRQSADNARDANAQAVQARQIAEEGGTIVRSAVESMQQINAVSHQISDIISVIDEIAFQTNLLALNAAVEAARVGEQGRGFAVVASEVRNLAGRSSTAAKEIKTLVQDTVRKVEYGTVQVNKSGEQLTEIVAAVGNVANIVAEIASSTQEQSAGIDQVNKAVIQMDEITQQNAALVEEAAAASQSMAQQAQDLQALVRRFKVDETMAGAEPGIRQAVSLVPASHGKSSTGTYGTPLLPAKPSLRLIAHGRDEMEEF